MSVCWHYGPQVVNLDCRIGRHGSRHQRSGGEDSGNAPDRGNAPDHGNDHNGRPQVHDGSLAHEDNRDDKHRYPAAGGQLTDEDRLVGEGHLYLLSSLADPDPSRDHHNTVMAAANGVGHANELSRQVRGDHKHPGADDCPLGRDHHRGVGHLNDQDNIDCHSSRGSGDRNDHYMGLRAVGAFKPRRSMYKRRCDQRCDR